MSQPVTSILQDHSLAGNEVERSFGDVETAKRITDDGAERESPEYQKKKYNIIPSSDKKDVDPGNLLAPEIQDILSRFYIIKTPHGYMIGDKDKSPSFPNIASTGMHSISPNKNVKRSSNDITQDTIDEEPSDKISGPDLKRILSRYYIIRTPNGFMLGDRGATFTNQAATKRSGATSNVNKDEEYLVPSLRSITSRFYLIKTPYGYVLGDNEQSSPIRL